MKHLAITMVSVLLLAGWARAGTITYSYDGQDRLTGETFANTKTEYRYDAANNLSVYKVAQDADGDDMPDEWEQHFFGSLTNSTATTDSDHDGQSDLAEYIAGTDPQNSGSYLKATKAEPGKPGFKITWASETNRIYRLERTTNLMVTSSFALLQEDIAGTPPLNEINDLTATNSWTYYYRIKTKER